MRWPMLSFLQDGAPFFTGSGWHAEALLWVALAILLAVSAGVFGIWTLASRVGRVLREGRRLEALEDLKLSVRKLAADREDLDLRRLEHVLVDVRDLLKRLEDAVLRSVEAGRRGAPDGRGGNGGDVLVPSAPFSDLLGDRVTNRLLAMGYERIHLVTRPEKLTELASRDGEVLVEARRDGVLHKGRVLLRGGRLVDVEIHPAYSIFP